MVRADVRCLSSSRWASAPHGDQGAVPAPRADEPDNPPVEHERRHEIAVRRDGCRGSESLGLTGVEKAVNIIVFSCLWNDAVGDKFQFTFRVDNTGNFGIHITEVVFYLEVLWLLIIFVILHLKTMIIQKKRTTANMFKMLKIKNFTGQNNTVIPLSLHTCVKKENKAT